MRRKAEALRLAGVPWLKPKGRGVYVIQTEDLRYFKVGITTHLQNRMLGIDRHVPFLLRLVAWWPGAWRDVEKDLLRRLKKWSSRGEWVHVTPESAALIASWVAHGRPRRGAA